MNTPLHDHMNFNFSCVQHHPFFFFECSLSSQYLLFNEEVQYSNTPRGGAHLGMVHSTYCSSFFWHYGILNRSVTFFNSKAPTYEYHGFSFLRSSDCSTEKIRELIPVFILFTLKLSRSYLKNQFSISLLKRILT